MKRRKKLAPGVCLLPLLPGPRPSADDEFFSRISGRMAQLGGSVEAITATVRRQLKGSP